MAFTREDWLKGTLVPEESLNKPKGGFDFSKGRLIEGEELEGILSRKSKRTADIKRLTSIAETRKRQEEEISSPFGQVKEVGKAFGELLGITPTAKKIAAGIAPSVVPESELPGVVEELAGGVTTPQPSVGKEFVETALDLPLISLGLSKSIAQTLGKQITKGAGGQLAGLLDKPLKEFLEVLPESVKKGLDSDVVKGIESLFQKGKAKLATRKAVRVEKKLTKQLDEATGIASESLNKKGREQAVEESRVFKEKGIVGRIGVKASEREKQLAGAIQPLVAEGKISGKKFPFENVQPIKEEIAKTNQEILDLIGQNKTPFNENQLRAKLLEPKGDLNVVFSTDPTIERTYNALVDAFVQSVDGGDTLKLFKGRQDFDKIPAVKKLLDGMKKNPNGESLRREAVTSLRKAANNFAADLLEKRVPGGGKIVLDKLRKEHLMFEVINNLGAKGAPLIKTTRFTRWAKNNPGAATAFKGLVVGLGLGTVGTIGVTALTN